LRSTRVLPGRVLPRRVLPRRVLGLAGWVLATLIRLLGTGVRLA